MKRTYTTVQGDMWDGIACKTLGDGKYTDRLIAANPAYGEIVRFPAGIVLTLPEITAQAAEEEEPAHER